MKDEIILKLFQGSGEDIIIGMNLLAKKSQNQIIQFFGKHGPDSVGHSNFASEKCWIVKKHLHDHRYVTKGKLIIFCGMKGDIYLLFKERHIYQMGYWKNAKI